MGKKNKNNKNTVEVKKVFSYCDNAYEAMALADKNKIDKETNTSTPSLDSVIETREFCQENKK